MEKNKKKVLIIVGLILALIVVITLILSIVLKSEDEGGGSDNPSNNKVITQNIMRLEDETMFFRIQKTLNEFYGLLTNNKKSEILKVLDPLYIEERNINANNLYTYVNNDYETTSYVVKRVYYNPNSSVTYYFINGYLIDIPMWDEETKYYENVNYLIIVDEETKNYTITLVDNSVDIESYAKSFTKESRVIENGYTLETTSVSEESKLTIYINEFLNLLVYDTRRAYSLLDDNTKKRYSSYEDFKNQIITIYSQFSSKVFSYSKLEKDNIISYSIKDDKQNDIVIYESSIMDYKIGY